jgi:hypothetical protein
MSESEPADRSAVPLRRRWAEGLMKRAEHVGRAVPPQTNFDDRSYFRFFAPAFFPHETVTRGVGQVVGGYPPLWGWLARTCPAMLDNRTGGKTAQKADDEPTGVGRPERSSRDVRREE